MALLSKSLFVTAALALATLSACASQDLAQGSGPAAGPPPPPYPPAATVSPATWTAPPIVDGLLPAPPSNAAPGECYAKVIVPGQPIPAPPPTPEAVWVLSPPGPGQLVPNWCLVWRPGAPRPVNFTPERFGWIRVICEKDANREMIRHVQRRLNAYGYYHGDYDGRYDAETAGGVVRFQEQRHIRHGGYLSVQTVQALDLQPQVPAPPLPPPPVLGGPACGQPACVAAGRYDPYGPYATPPYRSLLNWPGKTIY